jgi:mannosyltransferase
MTTLLARPVSVAPSRIRNPALAATLIGLAGFAISATGSWIPSLWFDEAATVTSATRSWGELWQEIQHIDAVHAVYYSLMHVVFSVFGYSPFTLRLPSAIAVGLTAALIIVLVRTLADRRLALVAGALYCLIPRVTWMGGEGRSYAFSALLAVVITLALVIALRSDRRMPWAAYSLLVVLGCLTFLYLALVVAAQAVTVAVVLARRRPAALRLLGRWLVSVVAAGILLIPFILLTHGEQGQVKWIEDISLDTFGQVFVTQWFWGTALLPIIAWALIAIGGFFMVRDRSQLGAFVLPIVVLPTVLLVAVSALYSPLYSPRYLSMCAPFVAIAMAAAVARLRRPVLLGAVFVVVAALAVPHIITAQRIPDAKQDSTWSAVAALVEKEKTANTAIIYGPLRYHRAATTRVIEYAYPGAFTGTTDVTIATPASQTGTLWETHLPLERSLYRLGDSTTAFLITSVKQDRRPSTLAALGERGWRLDQSWTFGDVNVVEYRLPSGTIDR